MDIVVYEMQHEGKEIEQSGINCVLFEERYFDQYMGIYNDCFYEMRRSLDIKPYQFLHGYEQIAEKAKDIYLLMENGNIIGSVACYGNEIDDLIVNRDFQNKGYGRQLLLWGMQYIRQRQPGTIILHVAAWNQKAFQLYQQVGFKITNTEVIKRG